MPCKGGDKQLIDRVCGEAATCVSMNAQILGVKGTRNTEVVSQKVRNGEYKRTIAVNRVLEQPHDERWGRKTPCAMGGDVST